MFNAEQLQEKWAPILDYQGLDEIKDSHRRSVTAILLENQEKELRESHDFLYESPTNFANAAGTSGGFGGNSLAAGPTAGFDPVLISLVTRFSLRITNQLCRYWWFWFKPNKHCSTRFRPSSDFSNQTLNA